MVVVAGEVFDVDGRATNSGNVRSLGKGAGKGMHGKKGGRRKGLWPGEQHRRLIGPVATGRRC